LFRPSCPDFVIQFPLFQSCSSYSVCFSLFRYIRFGPVIWPLPTLALSWLGRSPPLFRICCGIIFVVTPFRDVSLVDLHDLLLHFEHLNLRFYQLLSLALGPSSPRVVIVGVGLDRCSDGGWNAGFLRDGFPAPHGDPGSVSPLSDLFPFIQISLFILRYPVFIIQISYSVSVIQFPLFSFSCLVSVIQIPLLSLRYPDPVIQSPLSGFSHSDLLFSIRFRYRCSIQFSALCLRHSGFVRQIQSG